MTKGRTYWIPDLRSLALSEGFPAAVYDQCVAGITWGHASLERVEAHIANNGTPLPAMILLRIDHVRFNGEYFLNALNPNNPLLKDHLRLLVGGNLSCMPLNAEFLFHLFLTPRNCDALVGDLEERYRFIRVKFGKRRADLWYWKQTIWSIGPVAWAWGKKILMKPLIGLIGWAVASGVIRHDSWLAVVVEVWRRIRS